MDSQSADLILTNGKVITLDPMQPAARSIGIRAGVIAWVSSDTIGRETITRARIVDCHGATVLPGFIDAHCHLHAYAASLITLNLEPRNAIRSLADIGQAIHGQSLKTPVGAWISGRGYDEFYLAEKRHPTRWDLDQAAPFHPVKISHRSGNAHVLNSPALAFVGIARETPDPPEGIIERDYVTGEPTGLLYNMGAFLSEKIPVLSREELRKGIKMANENLLAAGITSLQDATAGNGRKEWLRFVRWKEEGILAPRVRMMVGAASFQDYTNEPFSSSLPAQELAAGGVKIVIHETTGRLLPDQQELNKMVLAIHRLGLQAVLHAIEEKAVESACTAIEYALECHPRTDHRHRIEHCALCPPPLARRLAASGIMVVTQPSFIYYHGERYLRTVPPEQVSHLYPLATLIESGIVAAAGSDVPVAPLTPLTGLYAAVSRRSETQESVEQKEGISPDQAIFLYTKHGAQSAFEEHLKGSIAPGKVADLVVLDGDPRSRDPETIRDIKVRMTIINGQIVWEQ